MDFFRRQTHIYIAGRKACAKFKANQSKITTTRGWIHKIGFKQTVKKYF